MPIENKALILDLLEWLAREPRVYRDVMDAWRTSCPRLPIWEDALDHGLVMRTLDPSRGAMVHISDAGAAFLAAERPAAVPTL